MNIGEYKGTVLAINLSLSEERPAIFTRVKVIHEPTLVNGVLTQPREELATHAVRLNNPDSQRIGFDELRSAFPKQLATLNDEDLLTFLIEHTSEIEGQPVTVGVEAQVNKQGQVQRGPNNQPYYNVRLRSGVKNLDHDSASSIAKRLLAGVVSKRAVDQAFDEAAA